MSKQHSLTSEPAPSPKWAQRGWIEANYGIGKAVLKELVADGTVRSFKTGKRRQNTRAYLVADIEAYVWSRVEGNGPAPAPAVPFDDRPEATEADIAELLRKAAKSA